MEFPSLLCHTGNTFLLSRGVFAFYTVCFLHYQHFLLHCSNQILHHSLHRLNLIRTVSITSTKQQRVIQRTLCRIGQSLCDAVRNISRITVLQALVAVGDLRLLSTLFHGRDFLQKRVHNCPSRHTHRTLGDHNIFSRRVDVGLLVALRCVAFLGSDKTCCHLDTVCT